MTESYASKIEKEYLDSSFRMAALLASKESSEGYMAEVKDSPAPSEVEKERFGKLYDKEMRRKNDKKILNTALKTAWRVAVCVMIAVTVSFSLVMSVDALRSRFAQLLISFEPEYAEIKMNHTDSKGNIVNKNISAQLTGRYVPSYIPDGFKITSMTLNSILQDTVYENGESFISLSINTENGETQIDTEDAGSIEVLKLNGAEYLFVEKNGVFTLVWNNESEYLVLITNITKEETIRIALSIEKIE